ncbi:protein FAR1-RELATED SEQUENCE 5-like [Dioscorea cayenensis subsp. rotundata]|uniref:Protein FAR1-RELATED SEQUENCE n=1 Tax=Dioscorea cayennensis subsp. rotundata TaxID=55577 RepID=A0AB40C579_DIOCR|nr:protein FAR1-RELATED SEQUENCE 5-like [Dioscorea cayenensis subsp. rotundata]XP_039134933.1 protein FAR1-RELATED SEQUENCE 5-like [Dioscorea cayenensis subsp. rotundata]
MEGALSEDDGLMRDSGNMDLNNNNGDPHMALALGALGVELNQHIQSHLLQMENSDIGEPLIGMEFDTDEAAKEYYVAYANRVGFGVRMNKSRRSRKDDTVIMRRFVCTREGFHSKRVIYDDGKKKRKRGTTREGCMAMIEVIRKDHGKWVVTKLVTDHTHMVALPGKIRPQLEKSSFLNDSAYLVHGESSGGFNNLKNFNRGIRVNPFGEGGEAQGLLEYLKRMQAENPAFFYAIQVDNNNCMTNVFWADAKSRLAYQYFGDTVTFDTTYKKTKYMMPFATFRGVNHHLQSVTFGCALLMDETKGSYIWLFETWLAAMGGQHPHSLVTDRDKAMEGAITRVFPNTRHLFCKWHILSRCKQKLSDVYLKYPTLKAELKKCVNESETIEEFETNWEYMLDRYNLWDNTWLQSLYDIRRKWATVYQKDTFFPELSGSQRSESLNKFFKRNFNTKTSLLLFIQRFDQAMATQYEKEAEADFATVYSKPPLKSPSPMEKQAAEIYTNAVFDKFQEEFVESLGYYVERFENGPVSKYSVAKEEDSSKTYIVSFSESEKKATCSCCKFESSGILCRHILRVFFIVGVRVLPEEYILKRWSRNAMGSVVLDERVIEPGLSFQEYLVAWYNDLCLDAVKYGMEGAISAEVYKVAKIALHNAFAEVVAAKNMQKKGQQNLQRFARLQKMHYKMPLPKLQTKKTPTKSEMQLILDLMEVLIKDECNFMVGSSSLYTLICLEVW